jgi:hypothetical protein
VNGSLITTFLRLRAARRELAAKQEEQQIHVVEQLVAARPALVGVAA